MPCHFPGSRPSAYIAVALEGNIINEFRPPLFLAVLTRYLNQLHTQHTDVYISLTTILCQFTDIIFPFDGLSPPLQMIKSSHDLGSIPSRWVIRAEGAEHSVIGYQQQPGLDHHRILLAPHKIHSALVQVIPATLLPATYHRLFSPKDKSP